MKTLVHISALLAAILLFSAYTFQNDVTTYSLRVNVYELRNSKGLIQFALYNKDGSIPDENYKKYYKMLKAEITNGSSTVTFKDIPIGKYAVNILHDENRNGKIDKGIILPKEGIGFSNFEAIGLRNKPNFSKASFEIRENKSINIKVIYF